MRRLLSILLLVMTFISGMAQGSVDEVYAETKPLSVKLSSKAQLFVINKSPNTISQVDIFVPGSDGKLRVAGSIKNLETYKKQQVGSFVKNELRKINGQNIKVTFHQPSADKYRYTTEVDIDGNLNVVVTSNDVIICSIPYSMNLKDKIFVTNHTAYTIEQGVIALVDPKGDYTPLAEVKDLPIGTKRVVASYKDNGLSKLRGNDIAIKLKGKKYDDGKKEESINYEFSTSIREEDHDLYIDVYSNGDKQKKDLLDF